MSIENNTNQVSTLSVEDIDMIKEARFLLWHSGNLEWKFTPTQTKIWEFYNSSTEKTIVINCSRRLGKTFLLTLMAIQQCLTHERSIVKFIMPETKMIRTILRPIMHEIFLDAPKELIAELNTQDSIYKFKNGSEIQLAGSDNGNYDKLRGGNCHLGIIDEAGFCSDLSKIIEYALIPTTLLTKGRIILSSTTPPDPNHEFISIMDAAEKNNTLIRKTIFDARDDDKVLAVPRITDGMIADIIKSYQNGEENEAFRTEYLCEIIHNSKDAVLPEFTKAVQASTICEWRRPGFCDKYVSMDIGFKHLTVVLFGYWDFDNGVLVIEDELTVNGPELTARKLAESVIKKEHELWTDQITGEFQPPYNRVSDNNLILINDLHRDYNLLFFPTEKQNKDAYIGALRQMIANCQIIIHPRCKHLISHMKHAIWDSKKVSSREFKESREGHHFDAVDALMYMVRNVDRNKNPYPKGYNVSRMIKKHGSDNVFQNVLKSNNNNDLDRYKQIINMKRSK